MIARSRRCFYCDRVMVSCKRKNNGRLASTAITRDHVIPKSNPYFPGDAGNTIAVCSRCNCARGDVPAVLFYLFARSQMRATPSGSAGEVRRRYQAWLREGCVAGRLKIAA